MALVPVLTHDPRIARLITTATPDRFVVARSTSWDRLVWLVRERPATAAVLDTSAFPLHPEPDELVADLRRRFPSLGLVIVPRTGTEGMVLLRLGRAAFDNLELLRLEELELHAHRAVARCSDRGARSRVLRVVGSRVPAPERYVLRAALDGALLGWSTDELAERAGWTRPHLSVRLKARGLPSAGRLLIWAKLLHAGHWLSEPGRSAESVSRQLEYANGPVFRRTLRNFLDATPTEVREAGGLGFVLPAFLDECGLDDSVRRARSVA